jgi:hypothetical protein
MTVTVDAFSVAAAYDQIGDKFSTATPAHWRIQGAQQPPAPNPFSMALSTTLNYLLHSKSYTQYSN